MNLKPANSHEILAGAHKRHLRAAQSTKHRTARSEAQKEKNDARVIEAHKA